MIYLELFYTFFLIGLFTFGGGYAMIPLIESETIKRGWLTTETFYNMVAISESTPGPIAVNMATFVGSVNGGVFGSFIATLGVILPSYIIILLIATILTKIIDKPVVKAILNGFKGVVIGMILATACNFLYTNTIITINDLELDIVAILIFIIILLFSIFYKKIKKKSISPYMILIISGVLGVLLYFINNSFL